MDLIGDDQEAQQLWAKLRDNMSEFFRGLDVKPSIMHGDMWSGNVGQIDGQPGEPEGVCIGLILSF